MQPLFHQNHFKLKRALLLLLLLLAVTVSGCTNQNRDETLSDRGVLPEVRASLADTSRPLDPRMACFNINAVQVPDWSDRAFTDTLEQLHAKTVRFPGGTVANYWDWQRGGIIKDTSRLPKGLPPFLRYRARRYRAGGLQELRTALELSNTAPVFVLNLLTSDLDSQLEMLRAASDLGIPVQYVELGNEFYFNIPNYRKVFPKPEDYASTAKRWLTAIKREFPEAQVSVVGVVPAPHKPARLQNWNRHLFDEVADSADAVTLHIYSGHGLTSRAEPNLEYPLFTSEEVPIILGEPFRRWHFIQEHDAYQRIPNSMKRWITEYNFVEEATVPGQEFDHRVVGSWTHGLYALEMALLFLEDPRVDTMCNHVLLGNSMFAAVRADDDNGTNKLSVTGLTLQVFNEAIAGMSEARQINFSEDLQLEGHDRFRYPALYGWMFSTEDEQRAMIVNLSEQTITVDLEAIVPAGTRYEQMSAEPRTLVESLQKEQGIADKRLEIAPYAIAQLATPLPEQ